MTKKLSPLIALILIPLVTAILAGYSSILGTVMFDGLKETSTTGIMLIFSILYFSMMSDVGLFKPFVQFILHKVKDNPIKVTLGTAFLSMVVALDGESNSTYLIVVAALFPLYKRLKLNPLILICIVTLTSGLMNMLPWSAPAARVSTSIQVSAASLFSPMIPILAIGVLCVFILAYFFGKQERIRLESNEAPIIFSNNDLMGEEDDSLKRPKLIVVNLFLTFALIAAVVLAVLPLPLCFIIAFGIALLINFPDFKSQQALIKRHAGNAVMVSSIIFSAGIFTGVLTGTGMIDAMGSDIVSIIPEGMGRLLNPLIAVFSIPFTFIFDNDSFYFGILPILSDTGNHFNVSSTFVGRASLIGQVTHLLSPLVPSAYLLSSLVGVEYSDHLKFSLKWAIALALILILFSILFGVI